MAQGLGLGVVGWSPLGGGLLSGKYRRTRPRNYFGRLIHQEDDARKAATVDAVVAIAEEIGVQPTQVALAWMTTRGVIPILGTRTPGQLAETWAQRR